MTPQLSTAYHEAAHAVIGLALGLPMVCAVLHPERGGRCDHGGATAAQLHAFCLMLYAGREAQRVLNGTLWLWLHPYSGDDKLAAPAADKARERWRGAGTVPEPEPSAPAAPHIVGPTRP
jgi:hypothetical protein